MSLIIFNVPVYADEELNVYTLRQPFLIEPLLDRFTEQTGIKVNMIYAKEGLLARLKAEGKNSPADVLITSAAQSIYLADQDQLLQSYDNSKIDSLAPKWLRASNKNWVALTRRARIIYASKTRVKNDEIKSYRDLAAPKWKGRICIRSGKHPYNLGLISALLYHWGETETKNWLEAVKANLARKPQGNDRAQVKAIWQGECDVSIGNSYYYGKMIDNEEQRQWAESVNLVFPTIGDPTPGTHINISGIGITKSAKNIENANKLIAFMLSAEAQKLYGELNWEYPVNRNVAISEKLARIGDFTADQTSLVELSKLRARASELIDEIAFNF
ncbi:MAG: extracellular solute-binding protein [Pseudomonadota bacterium]